MNTDAADQDHQVQAGDMPDPNDRVKLDFRHTPGPLPDVRVGSFLSATGALGAETTTDGIVPVVYVVETQVLYY